MGKKLSEMSLEELWRLFPIRLTEHRDCWADWYRAERARLLSLLAPLEPKRISHVGSTAVPGIWAKPIIDILLETGSEPQLEQAGRALEAGGYLPMSRSQGRISLNRGYTEEGFAQQVFHLHLRLAGDCDELYFRDYLAERPEIAREYEALKRRLWRQFEYDRDGYTQAKADFVRRHTQAAKAAYGGRY